MFNVVLALKCITNISVAFKINKSRDIETLRMAFDGTGPMLVHTANKIVRHADINCTARPAGEEIDVVFAHPMLPT